MTNLYDSDFLVWSEQQAEALLRHDAGAIDWENVAEEIATAGRNELRAVEQSLLLALCGRLQGEAWPLSRQARAWETEVTGHLADARRRITPAMEERIDLADLYRRAVEQLPDQIDGLPPRRVSPTCPFTMATVLE